MATPLHEHDSPCLENPHGQRNLAGYSPWGRKESDTVEVTNTLLLSCGCLASTLQLLMDLRNYRAFHGQCGSGRLLRAFPRGHLIMSGDL